ncbi:hypothetical protein MMC07_006653 [Pseudocyphellaria aurata]|nr:hypothetical protein [Pseudocyphellaria aurata]
MAVTLQTIRMQTTSPSIVDQARFAALEKQVELLVNQVKHLSSFIPTKPNASYTSGSSHTPLPLNIELPDTPQPSSPEIPAIQLKEVIVEDSKKPSTQLALRILDIIQGYGQNVGPSDVLWAGKTRFLPVVEDHVLKNESIPMVLPAFPFKSPNRKDKVLGSLPDLGEELALMHLNGLCESIAEIYEPGANVAITSDGLVYNGQSNRSLPAFETNSLKKPPDLMMIDDSEVWDYSTAVRDIIRERGLRHMSALRIVDLLDHHRTKNLEKEDYLAHAGCYRRELIAKYSSAEFDSREAVRNDKDTCMTYRGYIKFLTKDLKYSRLATDAPSKRRFKESIEELALKMIHRGNVSRLLSRLLSQSSHIKSQIFATAIEKKCQGYIRLSIHPSVGKTKLSIPLIPQPNGPGMTPWHSSIAVGIDGSFKTVHAEDVRDTHDLVFRNGRPYCFLQKTSDLFHTTTIKVDFEHLYPCGLIIRPDGLQPLLRDINPQKGCQLSELQSPEILHNFTKTTFIRKGHELGEVLPWTFGVVKNIAGTDSAGNNSVVSNEN